MWKIIGRHKHLAGIKISEMYHTSSNHSYRRYVATIRGWRGFRLAQGSLMRGDFSFEDVCNRAIEIRTRIDSDDESVFHEDTAIVWNAGIEGIS